MRAERSTGGPSRAAAAACAAMIAVLAVCVPGATSAGQRTGGGALPRVTVSDGRLVRSGDGRPLSVRGVNLASYLWTHAPDTHFTEESIADLGRCGVNLVRLAFRYDQVSLLPARLDWDPEGRAWLGNVVRWCSDNGIYVMLDMHVPPGSPDIDPLTGDFWDSPDNADDLIGLWELIAGEYKDEPAVLGYDLFNEPTPPGPDQWWDLVDRLVKAIRTVDGEHLLVVEPDLNGDLREVSDPGVLYSVHWYDPLLVTHRGADWLGDFVVPADAAYPGEVPDIFYRSTNAPGVRVNTPSTSWRQVSTTATVPEGINMATVDLFGWSGPMDVYFDDVSCTVNGSPVQLINGDMSSYDQESEMPEGWHQWQDNGASYQAAYSDSVGRSQPGSLRVWGQGPWTACGQSMGILQPQFYARVEPGDTVSVRAWIRAPTLSGAAGAGINWHEEVSEHWDRGVVAEKFDARYGDWAAEHTAALHIGEFGCMSRPGDASSNALVRDLMDIWNERGYAWTIWDYRESRRPGSGEFSFQVLDCPADESPEEGGVWSQPLFDPWAEALRQPAPAYSFYFAEGTTRPGFDTWLCVGNPSDEDQAQVSITYMKGDGTTSK
ncbi:MAG: glycoside hydrolase family 5 protein, partial [Actinobacteria bacterium]|nr:glycoside hydrolase family 5 protein [Actinomycetota bacterium]MBU1945094.1 glycoside hydrolase family 5 protein [Actinomycetota bacterium]MBU2687884.1 glycoside hydrolase family 5 protein [Actinomycetota bacterium]